MGNLSCVQTNKQFVQCHTQFVQLIPASEDPSTVTGNLCALQVTLSQEDGMYVVWEQSPHGSRQVSTYSQQKSSVAAEQKHKLLLLNHKSGT